MDNKHLSKNPVPGYKLPAFIGYVYLPLNISRADYIKYCFDSRTICVITENAEIIKNINIGGDNLQSINFPLTNEERGNPVLCVNIPVHNSPVVASVLDSRDDISQIMGEHRFLFLKKSRNGEFFVDASVLGDIGIFNIVTNSQDDKPSTIRINNENNKAKLILEVQGEIEINIAGLSISIGKENEISVKGDKISLSFPNIEIGTNQNKQPMLLGNKTGDFLSELIDLISQITVTTPSGASPINNLSQFIAKKAEINTIKSTNHKLD